MFYEIKPFVYTVKTLYFSHFGGKKLYIFREKANFIKFFLYKNRKM